MATVAKKDKKKKATKKPVKKVVAKKDDFVPVIVKEESNDPKHSLFEAYYTNPASPTFGNALRSAIKSGYSKSYADNILSLMPQWVSDIIGRMDSVKMAKKARQNLEEDLNLEIHQQAMGAFGPIFGKDEEGNKIPIIVKNVKLIEARQKATFFVAEKIDSLFNKSKKDDGGVKVDIKQIIIIAPNGQQPTYNPADRETVPSVSTAS